jgi:hypothetical protein
MMLVDVVLGRAGRLMTRVRPFIRSHRRVNRGGGCATHAGEHRQDDQKGA